MGWTIEDLEQQAKRIRYDLTALQGKISDLLTGIGELAKQLPAKPQPYACQECGLTFQSAERRDEHLANVHGWEVTPL
jgi:hypothetical protein